MNKIRAVRADKIVLKNDQPDCQICKETKWTKGTGHLTSKIKLYIGTCKNGNGYLTCAM